MELSLRSLARSCVHGSSLVLPREDYLQNLMGSDYEQSAFAPAPSFNSTYGFSVNIRGGKPFYFKGEALRKLDFVLKTSPYIRDVRCYVPIYFSQATRRTGVPDVKLDRVITIETKDAPGYYHLHAILTRTLSQSKAERLADLGVTFEKADLASFRPVEYENAIRLYQGLRLSNVERLRQPAITIASLLCRRSDVLLHPRLVRLLVRLQQDPNLAASFECKASDVNDLFRWTYAAMVLGALPVDLNEPMGPYQPLRLLPRGGRDHHGLD